MDILNETIVKYEGRHSDVRNLLAVPLVHVAICGGMESEEREFLVPFIKDLFDAANIIVIQVSEDSYRRALIAQLVDWLAALDKTEADAIRQAIKGRCEQVAEAVAAQTNVRISPEENETLNELKETLEW